jgi:phosphoribosyl 1,2-cyclic phosphodiesterase
VLIDAGLSATELLRRMALAGLDPGSLDGLVVTHEHRDHTCGVGVLARKLGLRLFAPEGVAGEISRVYGQNALRGLKIHEFLPGEVFEAGNLEFSSFPTSHDARASAGFCVRDGRKSLGFATDLGIATALVAECLYGCDIIYLEANHDEDMLANGPYPSFLKRRIFSEVGHLSNAGAGELLSKIIHKDLSTVVLAHLSEVNNKPSLAFDAAMAALDAAGAGRDVTLLVARQDRPGRVVKV